MSLADALERAASELPDDADRIRPANGDPIRLREALDATGAARVLAWLLQEEPAWGEELALAWAELPAGVEAIRLVEPESLPKESRKRLRRALHRLRSRGIEVDDGRRPQAHVATPPKVEEGLNEALVTAVDPSGAQLLVLAEPNPRGGARLFEIIVDDERGIVDFRVSATGRSQARGFLRALGQGKRLPAFEAPPDAVRARVARVARRHPAHRELPAAFTDHRRHFATLPGDVATPGELARAALAARPGASRETVVRMIEQGELGPWPPPVEQVRRIAERLHELAKSRLVIPEAQQRARIEEVLGEALHERFDGSDWIADRFEETAYALWKQGREDEAASCIVVAEELRRDGAATHPIPRMLLDRALRPVLEALREEEESSLLVKP